MSSRIAKKLGSVGAGRLMAAFFEALRNKILQVIYGFDPWHVTGNFHARPYKADVVKLIESVPHECVVEIGVGLGDILGRVSAPTRLGIDRDPQVLKAARFCVNGSVSFAVADFASPDQLVAACRTCGITKIDVLVLVNWIHMIDIETIEATMHALSKSISLRHIVMDTIRTGTPGYRFTHGADDLRRLGQIEQTIAADDVRDLVLIRVS